ncbi:epidermal differentiation-specific protein-like [Colossoma macropomum]|uniref:epidermal differentiation-specific protein-like n=1 Tax=Colossoma macropomum TaxID=42526 RepID=UPI001863FB86|nr:epidermal differentiation-specific protein-like [Colossoma macropomum]
MSKIILYEHVNFQGISREFTSSVSNLIQENFNDCISSLKVIGNPWVAYSDINFSSNPEIYEEGEYARVEHNDSISSLELVTEDLTDPQITLYEHVNYQGRSIVLKNETNLCHGSFNDVASSHKVQRGAWVLYEHIDRHGAKMVARASRDVPSYGWFNDRVSHLRPLKPGMPTITAEVLWDKKEEHVKSVILDSICGLNHGECEQSFSTELCREYEGSVTDNFSFSNATQITLGSTFDVDVEMMKASCNLSLSNTFTVEKGSSNTRTERKSVQISLPTTVPPHTKLTVNVVRKEVDVKVPVKLTITTGSHSRDEFGEYRCQSGNSITTEFKEDKI